MVAPIRDTQAIELRLGSWAISNATHVNTKYHSVHVNDLARHLASPSHTVLNKIPRVPPPVIIRRAHCLLTPKCRRL